MKRNRLYGDLAHLWPLVSDPKDYRAEAECWRKAIRSRLGPGQHRVLEFGVGGGHNLSHLAADFEVTAVDLSEDMLAHSQALNPDVEHHVGDMRSFRVPGRFDVVLIHDAIMYMLSEDDLRAAFSNAAAHLESGGIFITAPDHYRDGFADPAVDHSTRSRDGVELTYIEYRYDPDPADTTVEHVMHYFIREGATLRIEEDRHTTGIFPEATWLLLLSECGFEVEQDPYVNHSDGRALSLLVGRKE